MDNDYTVPAPGSTHTHTHIYKGKGKGHPRIGHEGPERE